MTVRAFALEKRVSFSLFTNEEKRQVWSQGSDTGLSFSRCFLTSEKQKATNLCSTLCIDVVYYVSPQLQLFLLIYVFNKVV